MAEYCERSRGSIGRREVFFLARFIYGAGALAI
jgi:hypothetical protein